MALSTRDITIHGRLSFEHIWTPQAPNENSEPKYSLLLIIPKTDPQIPAIQAAIQAAAQEGVNTRKFTQLPDPNAMKYPPLRDGDSLTDSGEPRGAEFAGNYFINAKSPQNRKPFIVDGNVQPIIDQSEVYSGCYVNVAVQFFPYANSGNKGISASLNGVQKVADGEHLGAARPDADQLFGVIGNAAPAAAAQDGPLF